MGLIDSPIWRRWGAEEDTSAHVLCECEALAKPRNEYLGSFFLDPKDVRSLCLEAIWNFSTGTELPWFGLRVWGTGGPSKGLVVSRPKGLESNHYSILFYSILFYSILFYSVLSYSILFYSILKSCTNLSISHTPFNIAYICLYAYI